MPEQQDRSPVAADHRSIVPSVPGVPWWAAIVIAVTGVAVGFAFDAGSGKELTSVFSGLYVVGCLAAVLAVRQAGVFSAVIQPPLILFCAVPGAYFLFHGAKFTGIKDLVINCGYPLIERFPLMLFTSAGVLMVGLVRWYLGVVQSRATAAADADEVAGAGATDDKRHGLVAWLTGILHRDSTDPETPEQAPRPRARREHAVERSTRSTATQRQAGRRPASSSPTRRPRPPLDDAAEPTRDRTRRRPARDFDTGEPPRRTGQPRSGQPRTGQPRDPDLRGRPPREVRHDPPGRRGRPASRFDPYEPVEPYDSAPTPPPRRRSTPNGTTATHHPISQVRYRKAAGGDEPLDDRPRRPHKRPADSWGHDV